MCPRWQELAGNILHSRISYLLCWLCEPTFLNVNFVHFCYTVRGYNTIEQNLMLISCLILSTHQENCTFTEAPSGGKFSGVIRQLPRQLVSTQQHVPRLVLVQRVQPDFLIRCRGRRYLVAEPDVVKDDSVPRPVGAVVGRARVAVDRVRGRWLCRPA